MPPEATAMTDQLSADLASLKIDRSAPPRRSRGGLILILLLLAGAAVLGIFVIYPKVTGALFTADVKTDQVRMISPAQGTVQLSASGNVVALIYAKVAAKVPGRIAEIYVEEGQKIEKDAKVARLEDVDFKSGLGASRARAAAARARIQIARSQVSELRVQIDRERPLVEKGVTAKATLDDLVARAESLTAAVRSAEAEANASDAETRSLEVQLGSYMITTPISGTVVDKLVDAFETNKESYTLGFFMADGTGGHATTPYAVVDKGNDLTWIMHYDNNFPGEERFIEVDRKANTWKYTTASNPKEAAENYVGDAKTGTLGLSPTSVRLGKLGCPFCGNVDAEGGATRGRRLITAEGDADLLIVEDGGKRIGHASGKLVNEIPGAAVIERKSYRNSDHEPTYAVPSGKKLTLTLDGSKLQKEESSDVSLFGPGYTMGVYDVELEPGAKDTIEVSADWKSITYKTGSDETPIIEIGISTSAADFEFEVHALGESGGQTIHLVIDPKAGTMVVEATAKDGTATYEVEIHRIDDHKEHVFKHKGVSSGPKDRLIFHYRDWKGNGQPMDTDIDRGGDGTIDASEDYGDEE